MSTWSNNIAKDYSQTNVRDWLSGKEIREIAVLASNGEKLRAVKTMKDLSKERLGDNSWGLKECKDFVDQLPIMLEDPLLNLMRNVEKIEQMMKDLPDLIVEAMPNVKLEDAINMASKIDFSELKRRMNTSSSARKFGI